MSGKTNRVANIIKYDFILKTSEMILFPEVMVNIVDCYNCIENFENQFYLTIYF